MHKRESLVKIRISLQIRNYEKSWCQVIGQTSVRILAASLSKVKTHAALRAVLQ